MKLSLPRGSIKISYHSAWSAEPFSAERFYSDQPYQDFARQNFDRHVGHCLLNYEKALCKERGLRYDRDEVIDKIASIVRMKPDKLKNLLNRSSRVVPKRRKSVW